MHFPNQLDLVALALRAARRLSHQAEADPDRAGWFHKREWEDEIVTDAATRGISLEELELRDERGIAGELIRTGAVAKRPVKDSRRNVYRATGIDRLTLGSLMRHAESCIAGFRKEAGRRTTAGESRAVEQINGHDWTRIKTAANSLAKHLHPASSHLREYDLWETVDDPTLWVWDPSSGPAGCGDWARMHHILAHSAPAPRLSTDRGAMSTLLDLAATHGLLPRSERHGGERWIIPVAWEAVQARWVEICKGVRGHHLALQEILRVAAQVLGPDADLACLADEGEPSGSVSASYPATERVLEHLRTVVLATSKHSATERVWIRNTLRALMDAGEMPRLPIDQWDRRILDRKKAWAVGHDKAIAAAHIEDWQHRGRAWADFPFPGLADEANPYSLRRAVEYFTATDRDGFAAVNVFPRIPPRMSGDGDLWGRATTQTNMTILAYFFGILQRYTDLDLETIDLRDAFTLEHAQLVVDAYRKHQFLTQRMARDILIYIGLISSPYLERVALAENEKALADRFFELSSRVSGKGRVVRMAGGGIVFEGSALRDIVTGGVKGRYTRKQSVEAKIEEQRERAKEVQAVYERNLGCAYAFEGMVRVYEAAKGAVLAELGVQDLRELEARWDEIQPNRQRLAELRNLSLWNDCLAAPMRARAISIQTMEMRRERGGRLVLDTPGRIHKVPENGSYVITLHDPSSVSGYDLEMWAMYRDRVRPALLDGRASRAVYVNDQRSGNTKYDRISERTVNYAIRSVLDLAGPVLGYGNSDALKGARSSHAFRHAVGAWYVNHGEPHTARILLHHATLEMVERVYSNRSEMVSTGAARAALSQSGDDDALLKLIRERPDLVERLRLEEKGEEDESWA